MTKPNDINSFSEQMSLMEYVGLARIHLKKIIFISIFITLSSIYITYTKHPVYKSTSSVIIKEKPGTAMVMNFGNQSRQKISNEIQLIKSRTVAEEVVRRFWDSDIRNSMSLFGTRNYYPRGESYRRILLEIISLGLHDSYSNSQNKFDEPYTKEIGTKFAYKLLKNVEVKSIGNTNVLEITFSSVFPDEARRKADMMAPGYKDLEKSIGNEDAALTVEFMQDLVKKQESELSLAEEAIKQFKITNNIYDLEGNAGLLTNQISTIESEVYNTISEINIRKEQISFLSSKISENQKSLATKISNDINAQLVVLRSEITQIESQLIQNTMLYGVDHGAVVELKNRLGGLKEKLNEKLDALISRGITVSDPLQERQETISEIIALEAQIFGFNLKKDEAEKLREIYNLKLLTLPDKQLQLARLKRDEIVLTENYSMLRQKLEEAKIKLISQGGRVQILDKARRSSSPISPNHKQDILTGIIVSLILSALIVFLIEFMDNSIRTISHIENLNLTVLGVIPAISGTEKKQKRLSFALLRNKNRKDSKKIIRRLITRENPRSPVSEAYRSLRTSMLYNDIDQSTKSILVSSAGPGEGKTTTVANMAITYANLGKKTLLIDTDLRRPVVHKIFNSSKEPGITNYLAGLEQDFNTLVKKTDIDNLYIVTSGVIPPNPSELLGSEKMSKLIKNLEKEWDIILFDSPPLVAVTDATMVSKEIDSIIIVVKVGQTDRGAFEHTIQSLKNVNAPLSGIVLNAVTQKNTYGSYYYYYYQYYNYYGSQDTKSV